MGKGNAGHHPRIVIPAVGRGFTRASGIHVPIVIPAKAGIHLLPTHFLLSLYPETDNMDSRFRGNDDP